MADDLKIRVGYQDTGLTQGIEKAKKSMLGLAQANKILNEQFLQGKITQDKLTSSLASNNRRMDAYSKSLHSVAMSGKGLGSALSANAIPATQEFSRVIQDAPYGIQGVANNIQQLTAQFGYLSAKTGGAKQAFKAMVSSLAGPAGILLGVSLVTAAMVQFGPAISNMITGSEDAKEAAEKLKEELKAVEKAQDDLIKKTTQLSTVLKQNAGAIGKALGLDSEEIKRQQRVIDQATLDGLRKRQSEQQALWDKYDNELNRKRLAFRKSGWSKERIAEDTEVKALLANKTAAYKAWDKLNIKANELQRSLKNDIYNADADSFEDAEKSKTTALEDALKERLKANIAYYKAVAKLQSEIRGRTAGVTDFRAPVVPKSDKGDIVGPGFQGISAEEIERISNSFDYLDVTLEEKNRLIQERLTKIKEQGAMATKAIADAMAIGATAIGDFLGDILSGGADNIQTQGRRMLAAFGSFLGQMGKMAIAYGTFQLAMALAGSGPPDPVRAGIIIAAGIGMVAVGKAISNKMKQAPAASSGIGGGGSSSFSGSSPSATSSNGGGGGTYVFEIEGTKLVGVLSRTLNRNKALGGSLSLA